MLQLKNSFSVLFTVLAIATSLLVLSGEGHPSEKSSSVGDIVERAARSECANGESVAHINANLPVHPDGSLIKEPGLDAIYLIASGKKSLVPSIGRVHALYGNGGFEFSDVVTVSSMNCATIPTARKSLMYCLR